MSRGDRKAMMRRDHPALSLSRQCKVLVGGWGESAMAGSTTLPSQGQAGSSVRSSAGCNAGGCGRYAAGPSEPDLVGSDWSA